MVLYPPIEGATQLETLRANGYTHKRWRTTPGPRTWPAHARASGQTVPIDQPFEAGDYQLQYPGDRGLGVLLATTVNCRCSLEFVALEERRQPVSGVESRLYDRLAAKPELCGLSRVDLPGVPGWRGYAGSTPRPSANL